MVAVAGLTGLRPTPDSVAEVSSPPYDVIKPGSAIEALLQGRAASIYHVILGDDPVAALERLQADGSLVEDSEPAFYVYEQSWDGEVRRGVFAAVETAEYDTGKVRRHEKTFDDKVQGRIALAKTTSLTLGPVFLLTKAALDAELERVLAEGEVLASFTSDFDGNGDLHGIANRIVRVTEASDAGQRIKAVLATDDLYIADGHHRYHAALRGGQTHAMAYITSGAKILAYNRVINGTKPFAEIKDQLDLEPVDAFTTPPKHAFCLYSGGQAYVLKAGTVPSDVVGRLDCSILERELYPLLGLEHSMIMDAKHFDYYAESELTTMQAQVDAGAYDLAVALHPCGIDELMDVADAGLEDQDVVMPEKSTFFAPKILTGLMAYRHTLQ